MFECNKHEHVAQFKTILKELVLYIKEYKRDVNVKYVFQEIKINGGNICKANVTDG